MNPQSQQTLPSIITDHDRKVIQNALREMSDSMTRIAAEKDLQKEIAETILEKVNVPKKDFNKLARIFHASNLMEEAARNEEFMEFAEAVMIPVSNQIENKETYDD
jgi:hypothetical protein